MLNRAAKPTFTICWGNLADRWIHSGQTPLLRLCNVLRILGGIYRWFLKTCCVRFFGKENVRFVTALELNKGLLTDKITKITPHVRYYVLVTI